jgi:hypothetical protein
MISMGLISMGSIEASSNPWLAIAPVHANALVVKKARRSIDISSPLLFDTPMKPAIVQVIIFEAFGLVV